VFRDEIVGSIPLGATKQPFFWDSGPKQLVAAKQTHRNTLSPKPGIRGRGLGRRAERERARGARYNRLRALRASERERGRLGPNLVQQVSSPDTLFERRGGARDLLSLWLVTCCLSERERRERETTGYGPGTRGRGCGATAPLMGHS